MRQLAAIIGILLCLVWGLAGCIQEKGGDQIVNPNDTLSTAYVPPRTTFLAPTSPMDTIRTPTLQFRWTGTRDVVGFSSRFDAGNWSAFTQDTACVLQDIDEGGHTFSVRSIHRNGLIEANPPLLTFVVDAVKGPAMMFSQRRKQVTLNEQFVYTIWAEEVRLVMGVRAVVQYSRAYVTVNSITVGDFAQSANGDTMSFASIDPSNGIVRFNLLITGGQPRKGISGSGPVAVLTCTATNRGTADFRFLSDSTTFRDTLNTAVQIRAFVSGRIDVQ